MQIQVIFCNWNASPKSIAITQETFSLIYEYIIISTSFQEYQPVGHFNIKMLFYQNKNFNYEDKILFSLSFCNLW